MTTETLLDQIIATEGGYVEDGSDKGGATKYGITAFTLGEWRGLHHQATRADVKALTVDEAKAIYRRRYVEPFAWVPFPEMQAQLVDMGVNQGVVTAIRALQDVLGVPVDGIVGQQTRVTLSAYPWRLTHLALIAARCKRYSDLAEREPTQRKFLRGWILRAVAQWSDA